MTNPIAKWRQRHRNPISFWLHVIGIPACFVAAPVLLILRHGWLALATFAGGYALQFIGHFVEGNRSGEEILVRRILGKKKLEDTMQRADIIAAARKLVKSFKGALAMGTVTPDGKPHLFWMGACVFQEPFTLYLVTSRESRKVSHIRSNRNVELLISKPDFSLSLTLSGVAEIEQTPARKKRVWEGVAASSRYFSGPDDPSFTVLKVQATQLRLWVDRTQHEPFVADL